MAKRRFPPPWTVIDQSGNFVVVDANGVKLAYIWFNDEIQGWSIGASHLTSSEARQIANGIARLPEFMMPFREFVATPNPDKRWKRDKPYNVAVENSYVQGHWDEMTALCQFNEVPFQATGQRIERHGCFWLVYEFAIQAHAIMFWREFKGRWMRNGELCQPDLPDDAPAMKYPKHWAKFFGKPKRGGDWV